MKNKKNKGFTLIELLLVIAIISLLSSVMIISIMSARQKSRNIRRLSDMTQMNSALELYFAANRGYPTGTGGIPSGLAPAFVGSLPQSPTPADEACVGRTHAPITCGTPENPPCGVDANLYYYVPVGAPYLIGGVQYYPEYNYYFCLGQNTGNFVAGLHILTPKGVK